jgi:hypothetical protein
LFERGVWNNSVARNGALASLEDVVAYDLDANCVSAHGFGLR